MSIAAYLARFASKLSSNGQLTSDSLPDSLIIPAKMANGGLEFGDSNRIINGGFTMSQRGNYTTAIQMVSGIYYLDRWKPYLAGLAGTLQHTTVSISGVTKRACKLVATNTGSGALLLEQLIEANNLQLGQTYVISALVRSNASNVKLRTFNGSDWLTSAAYSGAGNWQKLAFYWTVGSMPNGYINAQIYIASQTTGDYVEFTDVKVEPSTVATPFVARLNTVEEALCKRYFFKTADGYGKGVSGIAYANNALIACYAFPVQMRATPTIVISANGTPNSVYSMDNANLVGATPAQTWWDQNGIAGVQANSPFVANMGYSFGITASAEL